MIWNNSINWRTNKCSNLGRKESKNSVRKTAARWRDRFGRTTRLELDYFWTQEVRSGRREERVYQLEVLGEV